MRNAPLVRLERLRKLFPVSHGLLSGKRRFVHAVDDVSFEIYPGEAFGLVGESGCGKTTTGRLAVKLNQPTSGRIFFRFEDGVEADLAGIEHRSFRRRAQMIFQDPYESLNPRMTIRSIVAEPLDVQNIGDRVEREARVVRVLERVGLAPAASFLFRYPHELSGGQRQRVAIARAVILEPSFIVADEPTSMLDVSIRSGIINLLLDLKRELKAGFLYITHDLAVARYMCERIAVMYLGKIVEQGPTEDLINHPLHPYTRALISAVPVPDPSYQRTPPDLKGSLPRAIDPLPTCRFLDRCPIATTHCHQAEHPPLEEKRPDHWLACYEV